MTRKDLEAMQRGLSLEMIRRLHRELHIPLESLLGTAV